MKTFNLLALAFCAGSALFTADTSSAATKIENVQLSMSGFAYDTNFWAGFFPATATTGGPAPVSEISLDFTLTYITPVDQAYDFGQIEPAVSGFSASILSQDVSGLSRAGEVVSTTSNYFRIQRRAVSGGTEYDLNGQVDIFTQANGTGTPLVKLSFVLPGFFQSLGQSGPAKASYLFDSPKAFDAPEYATMMGNGGSITAQRQVQSLQAGPVPLPAGIWLGLTGLGVLLGLSRRVPRAA